jgi:acidic leucine-rich nuclear phosphoprotein 32 family protein A/C/D
LELFNNQFKGGDIKNLVDKIPKVKALFLGENEISEYDEVSALSNLKELTHLDLSSTALSEKEDYRQKIFSLIPTLQVINELFKIKKTCLFL